MRKDIICSLIVLVCIIFISIAYAKNNHNFWKWHDSGYLLAFTLIYFTITELRLFRIAILLFIAGLVNSWITSMFFDVTKLEWNQMVFSWGVASLLFIAGLYHNYKKYKADRAKKMKDLLCKRDARNKYKTLIERVEDIEGKLERKSAALDEVFTKILDIKENG
jgi:hypothetical protein